MDSQEDHPPKDLFQATTALNFIHLKLVKLTRDCGKTVDNGLASLEFFKELQDKLEKILHETRAACSPPLKAPVMRDFETVSCLGSGSFGTVNLVSYKETGQTFAMKTIKKESVTQSSKAQMLMERDILTHIDSSFVVSLFCSFETTTDFCLVMENAGGGDCAALLDRNGPLPLDLARLYVAETTLALEHIHSYGIVHRDLKPANMLISSTGHIKLADFGLALIGPVNMTVDLQKVEDINTIVREFDGSQVAGTPEYFAPEMIMGTGYGKPVDWWALGIILYEFLTYAIPFYGDTPVDFYNAVIEADITWPQESNALPEDAEDIVYDLLHKDCVYRLGTGGASDVKAHRFFEGLDWNSLLNQEVPQLVFDNTIQSSESLEDHSSLPHRMSDIPRHDEPPADEPSVFNIPNDILGLDDFPAEVEQEEVDEGYGAADTSDLHPDGLHQLPQHLPPSNQSSYSNDEDKSGHQDNSSHDDSVCGTVEEQREPLEQEFELKEVNKSSEAKDYEDLHHEEDRQLVPPKRSSESSEEDELSHHDSSCDKVEEVQLQQEFQLEEASKSSEAKDYEDLHREEDRQLVPPKQSLYSNDEDESVYMCNIFLKIRSWLCFRI